MVYKTQFKTTPIDCMTRKFEVNWHLELQFLQSADVKKNNNFDKLRLPTTCTGLDHRVVIHHQKACFLFFLVVPNTWCTHVHVKRTAGKNNAWWEPVTAKLEGKNKNQKQQTNKFDKLRLPTTCTGLGHRVVIHHQKACFLCFLVVPNTSCTHVHV